VDREKICPFLLRMFIKENEKHPLEEFRDQKVPEKDEVQVYTWQDATLKELAELVGQEVEAIRKNRESELNFAFVYTD